MLRHLRTLIALIVACMVFASPASGYSNGQLPSSALSPIATGASCNQLRSDAASGFNTMSLAAGHNLSLAGCASAYRTYAQQVQLRAYWCGLGKCGNAAVPGTSNHGLGLAVDATTSTQAVINSSNGAFGFDKACSDAPWEVWHYLFCRSFHRPDPGLNLASPTLRQGSGGPGQSAYVRQLQHLLRRAGARYLDVDGDFGKKTCKALRAFQRARGLKDDCIAGPNVWEQLRGPVTRHADHHHGHGHHQHGRRVDVDGPVSGIDVSNNQGSINQDDVAKDGIEFEISKATEGQDYIDPYFNRARLEAIRAQGMVAGAYTFSRPRPGRTGAVEGAFFVNVIEAAGYGVGDLRPVIDVETTTLAPMQTCLYVKSEVETVDQAIDQKSIIYTAPYFASVNLDLCGGWIADHPLWIANYGVSSPTIPAPWTSYAIWQHSDCAHVDGVSGCVDHNLLPGGRDALDALRIQAKGQGHGGDESDGTRDPVDGQHRHRPACGSRAHPHRCHLRRRCDRGHDRACRRLHHAAHDAARETVKPRRAE